MPVLLFQHHWQSQLLLTAGFAGLAMLAGKRIKFLYFLSMAGSITVFNLITPYGQVLFRIGPWAITEGALTGGIGKGVSIAGLVFISLFSVSKLLRIPGRFGGLLTRTFVFYETLLQERKALQPKALVISIDRLLERLYQPNQPDDFVKAPSPGSIRVPGSLGWPGILVMIAPFALGLGLLFWR